MILTDRGAKHAEGLRLMDLDTGDYIEVKEYDSFHGAYSCSVTEDDGETSVTTTAYKTAADLTGCEVL